MKNTLVMSVALDGYAAAFSKCISSQREYAKRMDYDYICIEGDGSPALGREVAWLKVPLLLGALEKYDYAMFLDSDTEVSHLCPAITEAVSDRLPIGLAPGHSGRANTGVILAKRGFTAQEFLRRSLSLICSPLEEEFSVGWGENGYLIKTQNHMGIELIDARWNNTFDPSMDDYVRHFTGPMRQYFEFTGDSLRAWEEIKLRPKPKGEGATFEWGTTLAEIKATYERLTAGLEHFAKFDPSWIRSPAIRKRGSRPAMHVHIAEDVSEDSINPYAMDIRDGLRGILGNDQVTTGVQQFWHGRFEPGSIIHIQWIESLFGWKVPTASGLDQFERRLRFLAEKNRIFYTVHNLELMPAFGGCRSRLLSIMCQYASALIHLDEANVNPFRAAHPEVTNLKNVPYAVVPHGDYQSYFRLARGEIADPALMTSKHKILVFGGIRSSAELDFCLGVDEMLGSEDFQMLIYGPISNDVLHWKEVARLSDSWLGGIRRVHRKFPTEQIVSLLSQVDAILIPRVDRLNSGIQFLAYTFLRPVFVPNQHAIGSVQSMVGGDVFVPGDQRSAANAIQEHFSRLETSRLLLKHRQHDVCRRIFGRQEVAKRHLLAYEINKAPTNA